ncbi:Uncharacterised protein [Yersinia pseudotuberculosis]|nr:hypothetical protein BZ16_1201 [Yersinia pseudotuberculosis PB1/+]CNK40779.1 Uncharacterised protein [Yersinia pseudotuberculosis]CNK70216.1 Uncharacterised protein [Yersinia pseudotuberculosis]
MNLQSYGGQFTKQFEQLSLIFAVAVAACSFKIVTWHRNKIKRVVTCHREIFLADVSSTFKGFFE